MIAPKNDTNETSIKTQREWVIMKLKKDGFITRNECLKNLISRLSDIIFRFKGEGWVFDSCFIPSKNGGKDYKYTVKKIPETGN